MNEHKEALDLLRRLLGVSGRYTLAAWARNPAIPLVLWGPTLSGKSLIASAVAPAVVLTCNDAPPDFHEPHCALECYRIEWDAPVQDRALDQLRRYFRALAR